MYNLTGKVALVTGAGSRRGFGRAIANRLAIEGADVAVVDKSKLPPRQEELSENWEGIDSVVAEIKSIGRQALAVTCDITSSQEVDRMVEETIARFGKVDILVNNAGVQVYRHLLDISDDIWNLHIGVNLTGTFFCSRAVAREMIKRGEGGRIINIGSLWGKVGSANGQIPYSASKFGVIGLTQSLALELAPYKILVNAVCPALTDTGFNSESFKDTAAREGISPQEARDRLHKSVADRMPLGRLGATEDLASMVAFLASEEADFITGQSINVNGGLFTAL